MIVIEGPDNSGKSTFAAHLSYEFGIPVYHAGGPPASKKEIFGRVNFILENHNKFIFDRIPLISEPVYCILRGGQNLFEGEEAEELYRRLRDINPLVIYCRPPDDIVLDMSNHKVKAHDSAEHLRQVTENSKKLMHRYDEVIDMPQLPSYYTYDYTLQEHDQLIEVLRHESIRMGHYPGQSLRPTVEPKSQSAR